jgi:regulator of sigma E protease
MINLIAFIFSFGFLVLAHEFGHFYLAKKIGVKVEEFGIGFPPRIFKWRKKETQYSLGLIPFGGFVKLEGEKSDEFGFRAQKPIKKIVISGAGIVFNIILAYLIFSLSLPIFGLPHKENKIMVAEVIKGALGEKYFKKGDIIEKALIDGQEISFFTNENFVSFVKTNLGKRVDFVILREGERKVVTLDLPLEFDKKKGALGIRISNYFVKKEPLPKNFISGFNYVYESFQNAISSFYFLILKIANKTSMPVEVVGPIGIYGIFEKLFSSNLSLALHFIGTISVYLAFLNFLPFPGLDGFHIFLALLESIRGKRLQLKLEEAIIQTGLALLFLLLFLVTFFDIKRLLQ